MKREFLTTGDGSVTIHIPDWDEQYHSKNGAIQEAQHVFIQTGLRYFCGISEIRELTILEIGFGTGLNAFLTQLEATALNINVNYNGIEAYPVSEEEVKALNYAQLLGLANTSFLKLHEVPWEAKASITKNFSLEKQEKFFKDISEKNKYHLVYFDAFGARVQPELWTEAIFKRMFMALKEGGVLVTYAAKGSVRRAMQAVGFAVERLPGPPGKREMLRATKPSS